MNFAGKFQILLVVSIFLLSACEEENCEPFTCGVCPEACERNDQCIDGELQCECNCTDDANYSLADSGSQPQSAACELAEQASMSGCPECDDGLVTCVYGDVSVTVGSCGFCQATNALYQALCNTGSQATEDEILTGLTCSSATQTSDAGIAASPPDAGANSGSQTTGLVCEANGECVYVDTASGLTWQGCTAGLSGQACTEGTIETLPHADAVAYCEDLSFANSYDWVMPTIDELRTLIRGCPQNGFGDESTCTITHECSYSTGGENTCGLAVWCEECSYMDGPGNDGCYWPSELLGPYCNSHWSSSLHSEDRAYKLNSKSGTVGYDMLVNGSHTRCVRASASQP
jgi:hypothetical protein